MRYQCSLSASSKSRRLLSNATRPGDSGGKAQLVSCDESAADVVLMNERYTTRASHSQSPTAGPCGGRQYVINARLNLARRKPFDDRASRILNTPASQQNTSGIFGFTAQAN